MNFNHLSIRGKLMAILMLLTVLVLAVSAALFVNQFMHEQESSVLHQTRNVAWLVANSCASSLVFDDPESATVNLMSLAATPGISHAGIFLSDGRLFAEYHRTAETNRIPMILQRRPHNEGHAFGADSLDLTVPVSQAKRHLGTLWVRYDLRAYQARRRMILLWCGAICLAVLGGALLVAHQLQRLISQPILELSRTMRDISRHSDYTTRSPIKRHDEIGVLVDGFNEMLTIIERRDQALKSSWQRLQSIVNALPDTLLLMNFQGTILDVLTPLHTSLFQSPKDIIGQNLHDLLTEENQALLEPKLKALIERGELLEADIQMARRDQTITFSLRACLMAGHCEQTRGIVVVMTDITQRRAMEEQLSETEGQLRQAQKLEAVGQLAGGVAHDFNNQLAIILGYADVIETCEVAPEKQAEYIHKIRLAAQRSADLTQQLLAFARKGNRQQIPVDLHHIVHEVEQMLERSFDKRITCRLELRAALSVTKGDPSLLQNAILNLAINARDAMPDGGTLTLGTDMVVIDEQEAEALDLKETGSYLRLQVRDTGTGIAPEIQRRIFEPFYTTKEVGRGTGMGLAAVYGILQSHQGAVHVDSKLGSGSTFILYLPLCNAPSIPQVSVTTDLSSQRYGGRALVVDDEEEIAELLASMLATLGFEVETCHGGRAALRLIESNPSIWQLVVLDLVMPDISGVQTYEQLRKMRPDCPVIVASGFNLTEDHFCDLSNQALQFIQKPFIMGELVRALEALPQEALFARQP